MLRGIEDFWSGATAGLYGLTHGGSVELAVTGLSRAGKTVLLTSLIHNLRCAGASVDRGGGGCLAGFTPFANGALRAVTIPSSGHNDRPRFPFEESLRALASDRPAWPRRTGAVSEIELHLVFGPKKSRTNGRNNSVATVVLRLVDYPGEWLLDLPLLGQSFDQWSAATLALSLEGSRAELSERWRAFIGGRNPNEPVDDGFSRGAAEHYRDYLVSCRKRGLRFLQPGHFLRLSDGSDDEAAPTLDRPQLWFCPLPPAPGGRWKASSTGAAMAARYQAYCSETVGRFVSDTFGRFRHQLVLVDVLDALNRGREVFEDSVHALAEVCRVVRPNSNNFWSRIGITSGTLRIQKVAYAATKADHVPRLQQENLANLLRKMLQDKVGDSREKGAQAMITYLSSVCSTEDDRVEIAGQIRDAVVGRRMETGKRAKVVPPPVPAEMPDRAYWERYEASGLSAFDYPAFMPAPISPESGAGIPQIGMERLLNFLIADRFQ